VGVPSPPPASPTMLTHGGAAWQTRMHRQGRGAPAPPMSWLGSGRCKGRGWGRGGGSRWCSLSGRGHTAHVRGAVPPVPSAWVQRGLVRGQGEGGAACTEVDGVGPVPPVTPSLCKGEGASQSRAPCSAALKGGAHIPLFIVTPQPCCT
jgi:hypothetical protein